MKKFLIAFLNKKVILKVVPFVLLQVESDALQAAITQKKHNIKKIKKQYKNIKI